MSLKYKMTVLICHFLFHREMCVCESVLCPGAVVHIYVYFIKFPMSNLSQQ